MVATVRWLCQNWSIPSVAEFILKMFHQFRFGNIQFGTLVNGLVFGLYSRQDFEKVHVLNGNIPENDIWDTKKMFELIYVLLVLLTDF